MDQPALPSMEQLLPLFFDAARHGDEAALGALLRAGVDVEAADARGHTALVLASYNDQQDAVRALLDAGAAPDGLPGFSGNSALMGVAFKGNVAIARLLLERGADPNHRNAAGQTALMTAALFRQEAIVDLLLAHGADRSIVDGGGNTAAALASAQGNAGLAERLAS